MPAEPGSSDPRPSLLPNLLEGASRLPLRLLQFPIGPIGLAALASYVSFATIASPGDAWFQVLHEYFKWLAVCFGAAALAAYFTWRLGANRWRTSVLLESRYLRQILLLAMLWQSVTSLFVLRSLRPWLELANALFTDTGAGASIWSGGLDSGFAAFVAVAIYLCPGALALAAVAPLAVALATAVAAVRKSRLLPRVLLLGALVQAAYWGGAVQTLGLVESLLRPVLQQMEARGIAETLHDRPRLLESIDPGKDRVLLAYLTQPSKTGRPSARQLGWLLLAPWVFVPGVFWRSRRREEWEGDHALPTRR